MINYDHSLLYAANRLFYHRISIHAPYPSRQAQEVIPKLKDLISDSNASALVFHPDRISDPSLLYTCFPEIGAVENLDRSKTTGRLSHELKTYKTEGFKFVLDLNHANSHREEAQNLIRSLIELMGDRLVHVHISGLVNERNLHCLYSYNKTATQAELITQLPKDIPLIHEGVILAEDRNALVDVLSREMQLLQRFTL